MLLKSFSKNMVLADCNPGFEDVHCIASLDQDIGEVLPYLNTALGGFQYMKDPPAVTFKSHGRLITVQARQISVNALKDEAEADKILAWLQREINETWENRDKIEPSREGAPKPNIVRILAFLPQTNCKQCGLPTCLVFATRLAGGINGPEDCPPMDIDKREQLSKYLERFDLDNYYGG